MGNYVYGCVLGVRNPVLAFRQRYASMTRDAPSMASECGVVSSMNSYDASSSSSVAKSTSSASARKPTSAGTNASSARLGEDAEDDDGWPRPSARRK